MNERLRWVACLILVVLLIPAAVGADIVVLRDGTTIEGTVANRESVYGAPRNVQVISILLGDGTQLRRIAVADVSHVVLIDGDAKRVVDFAQSTLGAPIDTIRQTQEPLVELAAQDKEKKDGGIALILLGGCVGGFGAIVKLGGEKATITETSIDYDEHSYNALNYILMAGGAVAVIAGIAMLSSGNSRPHAGRVGIIAGPRYAGLTVAF